MKRLICVTLILATVLCLGACGKKKETVEVELGGNKYQIDMEDLQNAANALQQNHQDREEAQETTQDPNAPTEEEEAMLEEYVNILNTLSDSVGNYCFSYDYKTCNSALAACYENLQNMEAIDRFLEDEAFMESYSWNLSSETPFYTRKELLSHFTVLEDVFLSKDTTQTVDKLGNKQENDIQDPGYSHMRYDATGRVCGYLGFASMFMESDSLLLQTPANCGLRDFDYKEWDYVFDDQGNVIGKNQYEYNAFNVEERTKTASLSYDHSTQGQVLMTLVSNGSLDLKYYGTLDAQGRLTKIVNDPGTYGRKYAIEFAYDDQGRKISEKVTETSSIVVSATFAQYSYNAQGHLESAVWTVEDVLGTQENTVAYTCDDAGRILSYTITYGDTVGSSTTFPPDIVQETITYFYGDYYLYYPV